MPPPATSTESRNARALTIAAHAAFVPIGVVTVLLAPLLPTLSARWGLSYSQAGALFTAQYLSSTVGVALSGALVTRWGFRFAMKVGLVVMALGVAGLLFGSRGFGMLCIVGYGAGLGVSVPAANLLVAEANPQRRSAALNLLNFSWSAGAVACPFLIAWASRVHLVQAMLATVAGISFAVAIGIAAMPSAIVEPERTAGTAGAPSSIRWVQRPIFLFAALFFVYVGTENAFGGWVASYAKGLGSLSLTVSQMTPSFFYAALMLGRSLATLALRAMDEVRLAQVGLVLSFVGMAGLEFARDLPGVALSASAAGLGLSAVYPITISLMSREFGPAASRVGSLMFFAANLGGGCLPWLVGATSSRYGTLKAGLAVPLLGSAVMLALYLRNWASAPEEQPA